jgi:hypothetical protein
MDAIEVFRHRTAAVASQVRSLVHDAGSLSMSEPLLPGTNPLGLTLWHIPRTLDWLLNTCVRGTDEVVEQFREGMPDPDTYGFGTGLTREQALDAAAEVELPALLSYTDAVSAAMDEWLASLSEHDLDEVPPLQERQAARAPYNTPEALAEVEGLFGQPLGVLLMRPTLTHLFWHMGEVELLIQLGKAS